MRDTLHRDPRRCADPTMSVHQQYLLGGLLLVLVAMQFGFAVRNLRRAVRYLGYGRP